MKERTSCGGLFAGDKDALLRKFSHSAIRQISRQFGDSEPVRVIFPRVSGFDLFLSSPGVSDCAVLQQLVNANRVTESPLDAVRDICWVFV